MGETPQWCQAVGGRPRIKGFVLRRPVAFKSLAELHAPNALTPGASPPAQQFSGDFILGYRTEHRSYDPAYSCKSIQPAEHDDFGGGDFEKHCVVVLFLQSKVQF